MSSDPATPRPLDGYRVVEFGQLVAGPNAGMILSAYGADVIKVEPPGGDPGRALLSSPVDPGAATPSAVAFNQGKRSIILDLKRPEARQVALALVDQADVLIESSRPGAMDRLGLGADACLQRNPRLVYASVSAFGQTGPERTRGGVDIVIQAESGMMSVTGESGGQPLKVGFQIVDVVTGHVLAQAILGALLRRERFGHGDRIDISLVETAMHLQSGPLGEYFATGRLPVRSGNSAPQTAPADLFDTADSPIVVTGYLDSHWKSLCELVGHPELIDDPRFGTKMDRVLNRKALFDILQHEFVQRPASEWLEALGAAGLAIGVVKTYADLIASEHLAARDTIRTFQSSDGHEYRSVRLPPRFAGFALEPDDGPPAAGGQTHEVLSELGFTEDEVGGLLASGAAIAP